MKKTITIKPENVAGYSEDLYFNKIRGNMFKGINYIIL